MIILASASPRRYEILKNHGIDPLVVPSDADETLPPEIENLSPSEIVTYLAQIKARAVYERLIKAGEGLRARVSAPALANAYTASTPVPDEATLILAADTIVYKGEIIGKPTDAADAFRILSLLRNTTHSVFTGVSLIDLESGEETHFVDETKVRFKDYLDAEIRRFIMEEAPYDKSGSYAIQSSWSKNISRVDGDVENVMGLPWYRLEEILKF